MKKFFLIFSVALISASAQGRWVSTSHDFGAFDEEMGAVTCTFTYINDGSEPVYITAARASCGCTSPRYSRDAIAPGESSDIEITYDPAGRPGKFTKYVAVTLSDNSPMEKLYIKGTVVGSPTTVEQRFPADCGSKLKLAKGALMVGETNKGQTRTVFLEGYNRHTDSIRPKVLDLPPYITVNPTPETVAPGEQFSFVFYFDGAKCPLYGLVNDTLTIDGGEAGRCTIPAVALVREDFSKLSPKDLEKAPRLHTDETTVDFGRLDGAQTKTVTINNVGKSPLKIRRVYSADAGITASCQTKEIKPGKSAQIQVTADPAQMTGALLNARLSIITNDPDSPTTNLRLVGQY